MDFLNGPLDGCLWLLTNILLELREGRISDLFYLVRAINYQPRPGSFLPLSRSLSEQQDPGRRRGGDAERDNIGTSVKVSLTAFVKSLRKGLPGRQGPLILAVKCLMWHCLPSH